MACLLFYCFWCYVLMFYVIYIYIYIYILYAACVQHFVPFLWFESAL